MIKRLLLSVLLTLPALGQISFSATRGTTTGGDIITITGTAYCGDCAPPDVTFGGIRSQLTSLTETLGTITAITPPHAPGTVDVKVGVANLPNAFSFVASGTLIDKNYERILIPLSLGSGQFPGGYGSLWASEIWIYNNNPWAGEVLFGNPNSPCCIPLPVVPHAETRDARYIAATSTPFGLVAWAQKGSLRGLSFSLQVRDVSRAKLHSGTELPVVPESEFRESVDLLNVPIEPASARTALRIYTLDTTKELPVHIAISPAAGGDPLVNDTVVLQPGGFGGAFQSFAFFSSLDDLAVRYPVLNGAGPVQITVSTASKTPIWAFSAITNNDTQLITTVVPH